MSIEKLAKPGFCMMLFVKLFGIPPLIEKSEFENVARLSWFSLEAENPSDGLVTVLNPLICGYFLSVEGILSWLATVELF